MVSPQGFFLFLPSEFHDHATKKQKVFRENENIVFPVGALVVMAITEINEIRPGDRVGMKRQHT